MRPHQLVIFASLGLLIGCLLTSRIALPWLGVFCLIYLLGGLFAPPKARIALLILILFAVFGGFRYHQSITSYHTNQPNLTVGKSQEAQIKLVDEPVQFVSGLLRVKAVVTTLDNKPEHSIALLTFWGAPDLAVGDELTVLLRRTPPPEHIGVLLKDNINFTGEVLKTHVVTHPKNAGFVRQLYFARRWAATHIRNFLPEPESQLINGLLLGLRTDLPDVLKDNLQRSGTTHIVALSGFNITMVITFLVGVLGWLPRRQISLWAGIGILLFIVMTGLSSSVVRAAVMGWLMLLSGIWGRKPHMGTALVVAGAGMVALNPLILQYDIGFQLSLVAMAGLIFIGPIVKNGLPAFVTKFRIVTEVISSTLSATLATLPLVIFYFGGVSAVGLFANLLIVPLVPTVMILGLVGLIVSLGGFWAYPLSWLIWAPAHILIVLINFFGGLPWAYTKIPTIHPGWLAVAYLVMIAIIIRYAIFSQNTHQPSSDLTDSGRKSLHLSKPGSSGRWS